ncbi:hypothetical protein Hamer_G005059 [Homarus americanus]|uniref:Uncharacterized protein n=1 Tax=Homarus americanus TaxID=6706 RepID=A0A8J5JZQ8_HOMAM|nr:hypothetical protein Hamer_G005059 [Homarus americanus]
MGPRGGRPVRGNGRPVGCDGRPVGCDGLRWTLQTMLLLLVIMASITPGQGAGAITQDNDCSVHHVEKNKTLTAYFTGGKVVLGLLPMDNIDQVLSGMNFSVYKHDNTSILKFWVPLLNGGELKCSPSNSDSDSISADIHKLEKKSFFEWNNISLSIKNESLSLSFSDRVVCPSVKFQDNTAYYLTVTPTRNNIYVVLNCDEGCPIFDDSLARYSINDHRLETKKVFVRNTSTLAWAILSQLSGTESDVEITASQINSGTWEELNMEETEKNSAELSVGSFSKTFNFNTPTDNFDLELINSSHMEWAVGCKPTENFNVLVAIIVSVLLMSLLAVCLGFCLKKRRRSGAKNRSSLQQNTNDTSVAYHLSAGSSSCSIHTGNTSGGLPRSCNPPSLPSSPPPCVPPPLSTSQGRPQLQLPPGVTQGGVQHNDNVKRGVTDEDDYCYAFFDLDAGDQLQKEKEEEGEGNWFNSGSDNSLYEGFSENEEILSEKN